MATYRTPDVYVEEISVFPPSVAEVETAIPAFIGYTARATRMIDNDLDGVPTRVTSLLEYESLFGGAPALDVQTIQIDAGGRFQSVTLGANNTRYLYDALRLFFDNGGGPAWIVSVGRHADALAAADLIEGLAAIAAVDEPTLLLTPDAAGLADDARAQVQIAALAQCGRLGDRIALLDTGLATTKAAHDTAVAALRNGIGINHLKYGAAYSPWLKLAYAKPVGYTDIVGKLRRGAPPVAVALSSLTGDPAVVALVAAMDALLVDQGRLPALHAIGAGGPGLAVRDAVTTALTTYQGGPADASPAPVFAALLRCLSMVDAMLNGGNAFTHAALRSQVQAAVAATIAPALSTLVALDKEFDALPGVVYDPANAAVPNPTEAAFDTALATPASNTALTAAAADGRRAALLALLQAPMSSLLTALDALDAAVPALRANTERQLLDNFAAYRDLVRAVSASLTPCPPSGAIAGICALVDNQRGVWKAPANVSLNGVVAPAYALDSDDTDRLNVDAVAGKSVNAIRAFVGKGTLVWGARTLAGNDNEWRYVSVRRFFNMVEESVKKSTYWAVFEPNDANTWVKVRGMIDNYLTQKWREGALAGATTKDAFFVRCGLGQTMNAQDVLEGRMIVEIGMAVVRPAEFIILRFSHKLQTS